MIDKEDRSASRPSQTRDPDEALYRDFEASRKFRRLNRRKSPKAAKLRAIRSIDVSTGTFALAKETFDALLDRVESGTEGVCFVLHGETGAGKTHILKQLQKDPDLQATETEEGACRPLVTLSAPAPCTLTTLGLRILHRLGYRPRKKLKENEVWDRVYANLTAQGVGILLIDEMHNVFAGRNQPERVKIAMTLKSLMVSETNPIQLVLSGLDEVQTFVLHYEELERRSHFLQLTPLVLPQDRSKVKGFLEDLEEQLGFPKSGFAKGDMPERFVAASRGLPGRMAYFAQEAAALTVAYDDTVITDEHLGDAFKRPYPCKRQDNPFLMANVSQFKPRKTVDKTRKTLVRGLKRGDPGDAAD